MEAAFLAVMVLGLATVAGAELATWLNRIGRR